MKFRLKKRYIAIAAVNVLAICTAVVLSAVGSSHAKAQTYNYAAEKWQGSSEESYTQISCFFSENSGFDVDSIGSARMQMLYTLQTVSIVPEEGENLCPDAYSAPLGQASVKGDISGRSEADVTAVGGDFFFIHDFKLIDGAFFSDDDIMQDGVVIDRSLAWALYGSHDIAGMNLTINGTEFYIAGVIEDPSTDEEKKCAGELPKAYISYDGASLLSVSSEKGSYGGEPFGENVQTVSDRFTKVTCYEFIMPDPVENFAYTSMQNFFLSYGKEVETVENTGRFEPSVRIKKIKSMTSYAVKDNAVAFPYWENASRIIEFRLTFIYFFRTLSLAVPVITGVWLIIKAYRYLKKSRKRILKTVFGFINNKVSAVKVRLARKS